MGNLAALRVKPVRAAVSPAEWEARVDLAACFRLVDLYGMSDMIYTHATARVPGESEHFLINPHGMLFREITASSLLKVHLDGRVMLKPDLDYGLQQAGYVIHSAIYRARADVMSVIHTHTTAGMAVSSLKCGLLPLTQTAMRFYARLAYHDFSGPERDPGEREKLASDLGQQDVMILRNHGLLSVGPSIPEAFNRMYGLERSCQAQMAAMACNTELNALPADVVERATYMYSAAVVRPYGILEWPALLRQLDDRDDSYRN
ncbi:MAG TPA: class II aldolase/adducin family protein [Stellaceae bacterium]|nr:class II aldolase/adducin family protein [Stellaceae bacterium]